MTTLKSFGLNPLRISTEHDPWFIFVNVKTCVVLIGGCAATNMKGKSFSIEADGEDCKLWLHGDSDWSLCLGVCSRNCDWQPWVDQANAVINFHAV